MKRILVLAATLSLVVASLAGAAPISVEVGGVFYNFNTLASTQGTNAVTNKSNFAPYLYANGSYTMPLDKEMKLKLGLQIEDIMGTISPSFVHIGRAEPYADFSSGPLSARLSFPIMLMGYDSTNDPKYAEIGYIHLYKGISLGTYYDTSNSFLLTTFASVGYKLSLDKTTSLVFSASTEIGLVPSPWLYDIKPQVTVIYGPVQFDFKESIYFANSGKNPSTSDVGYNLRFFTDPKLTYNFADLGVKGLKAYLAASLYTYNSYPNSTVSNDAVFYGNATSGGKAKAFGSSVTPGVSYSLAPFYVELALKFSNYDASTSNGKDPTFDPSLKFSYTLSF
jgi:hypothetical protein